MMSVNKTSGSIFLAILIAMITKYRKDLILQLYHLLFRKQLASKAQPNQSLYSYRYPYTPNVNIEKEIMELPLIKVLEEKLGPVRPFQNPKWLEFYQNHFIRGGLFNQDIISYAHSHYSIETKTLVSLIRLESRVCGHKQIVHGGLCAALFDEILGEVFYCDAEGKYKGFTASLTVNYRSPMPANNTFVWCVQITKREGRKVYLKGQVRDPVKLQDEQSFAPKEKTHDSLFSHLINLRTILYAEAEALFIIPKTPLPSNSAAAKNKE